MDISNILPTHLLKKLVTQWLSEDIPNFDYGGFVVGDKNSSAILLCKSNGILCGKPFVDAIFKELNCEVDWYFQDGYVIKPSCKIAEVRGPINKILQGERLALNILTRASGIASLGQFFQVKKEESSWHGEVAATRKTTPGFRLVEKYAVMVSSCSTHRYDLSSMVMLKDNHIWSMGSIKESVKKARSVCGFSTQIEVECRSVKEALEACRAGANIVMLDNFDASITEKSAQEIKKEFPRVIVEVSGGVTKENIQKYMTPSVDVISTSTLAQGYSALDFSMKIVKEGKNPLNPLVTEA